LSSIAHLLTRIDTALCYTIFVRIISHAYFPHDAMVSLVNVMEDGGSVEVGLFGCEGVLGLLGRS
jgi:hypothetical protein